jgi:hypothetical protein
MAITFRLIQSPPFHTLWEGYAYVMTIGLFYLKNSNKPLAELFLCYDIRFWFNANEWDL